tara:strand:- start:1019 stop:1366 length:348 start_codon:yes stop_codon:yes gene_type:complete
MQTILVISDNTILLQIMVKFLQEADYTVKSQKLGDVLDFNNIDCLVIDVQDANKWIPIVKECATKNIATLVTISSQEERIEAVMEKADECIQKPFTVELLKIKVGNAIDNHNRNS